MFKGLFYSFFLTMLTVMVAAQESSNAYLLAWENGTNLPYKISKLDLLTGFNKKGYNNQPNVNGNRLYLASSWKEKHISQTNLISLDLEENQIKHITQTKDSEFSPILEGNDLYFVRQVKENKYQELWKYNGSEMTKALPETNVAYFKPISENRVAAVLIENNQLVLYDINLHTNEKKRIISSAGRSLAVSTQQGLLYFVHKYSPEYWYIKTYDLLTGQIKIVTKTLQAAEDFFLEKDKYLWMAKSQRIYRITLQNGIATSWDNIFNLEPFSLNNIGRLCVINANQLIFINQ